MTQQPALLAALTAFSANLTSTFAQTTVAFQPEDQLKGAVDALVKQAGSVLNLPVLQIVTEVKVKAIGGRPDMGISRGGSLIGYIELKAPGKGARPQNLKGEDKRQWGKFKNLPNLIYTDGNEWSLFRTGEPFGPRVQLHGDVTTGGAKAVTGDNAADLLKLFQAFFAWQPITPSTPKGLAQMLAPLCRLLRDEVATALDDPQSNLSSLAEHAPLPADGPHIYLNDTLDSPHAAPPGYLPMEYRQIADEHKRANRVKESVPVLVCIGNPPYDRQNIEEADRGKVKRKGGWVRNGDEQPGGKRTRAIFDDFTEPLEALGLGVHAKNLYNDYVYFWRWALWKVFEHQPGYGIVSFITASSYLRGPGFAGMRQVMRATFDELWIIDLEGDNLGARKTENVFAIQTPVAIATGVRYGKHDPATPAVIHHTRMSGTTAEKLSALAAVTQFADLPWRPCFSGWTQPLLPAGDTPYWNWPLLTDLFPWQANGMQFKRTRPISESRDVLERRWQTLLAIKDRRQLFKESRDRLVAKSYPLLTDPTTRMPTLASLDANAPTPNSERIAFRSFDRQWAMLDNRLGDYLRPSLHAVHGDRQIYMTSLLTEVFGEGPAAVATALIPDLHHFRGSFGGAHVIPLWRDAAGTQANIASGVLAQLAAVYRASVAAEDVFAYCYALLATPDYVTRHWDELTIPGPRVPLTRDAALFAQGAALGKQLLWLHSFGERFVPPGKKPGKLPPGQARIAVGTPTDAARYPERFGYTPATEELRVGDGIFSRVRADIWNFSVSGLQVIDSWLGYRMRKRAGKSSSPLDELRPQSWQFDDELLELLWMLEAALDLLPQATALLDAVTNGPVFVATELPAPAAAERRGSAAASASDLPLFAVAGVELEDETDDTE